MKQLFSYFIHHYKINFVISVAGLILGITGLNGLRREARPPVDFARVIVLTTYPGASSAEVEEFITNKLEQKFRNIQGIKKSSSLSSDGMSQITMLLDLDNTDVQQTVNDIYRAVQNVNDLPSDLLEMPQVIHAKASEIPIMTLAVTGPDQKRNRVAYELKLLLQNLPNIAGVDLSGFQKREYQILIHPEKIKNHSVSLNEVVQAVKSHSKNISAGSIRSKTTQHSVRLFGKIKTADELENIIVRSNFSGKQVAIKDIAAVKDAEEEKTSYFFVKDKPAVSLIIKKKEKADMLKAVQQIKQFLNEYKNTLNSDIKLITLFDESKNTKRKLDIVTNNALFGLVLVLLILWFFLPGWIGVVTAFSLPFSILCSIALMASFGITFNIITMCAFIICIGMFVDDAVVISEYYAQWRAKNVPPIQAALESVVQLWKPIVATTATTIMAFLPMLLTKGVMGEFIKWMPIVISIALTICLIESFFLLPCRLRFTLRKKQNRSGGNGESALFSAIKKKFESFILKTLERKYLSLFIIVCIVAGSLSFSYLKNRFILFPKENVEIYSAVFELDKKLSPEEMEKRGLRLSTQIRKVIEEPNIKHSYFSINNLMGMGFKAGSGSGSGALYVEVHDKVARKWNHTDILKKLRTVVDHTPFKKLRFTALRMGPPVGRPVELILFSQNEQQLNSAMEEISKTLPSVDGLLNLEHNKQYSGPEYAVYPDTAVLSSLGLNTTAVGYALKTALHGNIIAEMTEQGESFYIRVKYDNKGRSNIDSLKYISILSPGGQLIPMDKVVRWTEKDQGPEIKKHYSFSPSFTFYADVDLNKTTSILANAQIQKKIQPILKKYSSVSYKQAGEKESTQESLDSLKQATILVIFCIFATLLLMFNSFSLSILILSNVFLGLVGVSWSFLLHSKPLSFFAMMGTVGLAGVVINSAIILVSFIEKQKKLTKEKNLNKILASAAAIRLRPIVITSTTTVFGLFPTAYGIGGYDPVLIPITLSLTWGLISGTFLTLIWTPCGYAVIYDISNKIRKLITHFRGNDILPGEKK